MKTYRQHTVVGRPAQRLEGTPPGHVLEALELVRPVVRGEPLLQRHPGQLRRGRDHDRVGAAENKNKKLILLIIKIKVLLSSFSPLTCLQVPVAEHKAPRS